MSREQLIDNLALAYWLTLQAVSLTIVWLYWVACLAILVPSIGHGPVVQLCAVAAAVICIVFGTPYVWRAVSLGRLCCHKLVALISDGPTTR
jgi:hypothetical protein